MSTTLPQVIVCDDFHDYLEKCVTHRRRLWAYRGHANSGAHWKLESKLFRFLTDHKQSIQGRWWPPRERAAIKRFQAGAHLHLGHIPEEAATLSWLALMQHYGAPTRLIDFSLSPAVGFFFSIHGAKPEDEYSVHAVHLKTIRAACFERITRKLGKTGPGDYYTPVDEDYAIGSSTKQEFVGVAATRFSSPRQQAQEGLFLVPSQIGLNVEDWINSIKPDGVKHHWIEFKFPKSRKVYDGNLRQFLQIALSPTGLFPGLEGLAQSARYSWFEASKDYLPTDEEYF